MLRDDGRDEPKALFVHCALDDLLIDKADVLHAVLTKRGLREPKEVVGGAGQARVARIEIDAARQRVFLGFDRKAVRFRQKTAAEFQRQRARLAALR